MGMCIARLEDFGRLLIGLKSVVC